MIPVKNIRTRSSMGLFDYPGTSHETETALNEITLLADLSEQNWARVLTHVETRQFKFGENLINIGQRA